MTDDDKTYHDACARLFADIETLLEDAGADFDNNGSILEIETAAARKIVINKQPPMREVWLAAKSGGRHYRLADGDWRDTRDGSALLDALKTLLQD